MMSRLERISVSGVFNSWFASVTNCFCLSYSCATGLTARFDIMMIRSRMTRKLAAMTKVTVKRN